MEKRTFATKGFVGIGLVLLVGIFMIFTGLRTLFFGGDEASGGNLLFLPPLLENQSTDDSVVSYLLRAEYGTMEFLEGKTTATMGYNGDYLGPVLKVKRGQEMEIKVENRLDAPTTVHWHGMELPGVADGGPHQDIVQGDTWTARFKVDQPAATLWFHPHFHRTTGPQVYQGLAGLIFIEDEVSERLDLPKDYGINDIPLVVQDRNFTEDGAFRYELDMRGLQPGDTLLVNGTVEPYVEVRQELVRLRLLNGSNFENFNFRMEGQVPFYQIATDGGFLEAPVELLEVTMAPGERVEILVDFRDITGDRILLLDGRRTVLEFRISEEEGLSLEVPKELAEIVPIDVSGDLVHRTFSLESMGLQGTINGKSFNLGRIDEEVRLGATEIWTVTNRRSMMHSSGHPFHVHGTQFQILSRNGNPPAPQERGWKDTVYLDTGEELVLVMQFHHPGVFMYHCHMLEHEDYGMMGQFRVE